jgi:hypothetical protein
VTAKPGSIGLVAGRALRGTGSVLAIVVTVGIGAFLLAGRGGQPPEGTPSPSPVAAAAASSPEPSAVAPSTPATPAASPPDVTASPTVQPTPEPTPTPTPEPPDPTPAPTKRPPSATPKPVVDPAPEPTPVVYRESGSFGSTLSAGGVTVSLDRHAPSSEPRCVSDDPEVQGFTEIASFTLEITWSKSSEAMEPFVAVGSKPYFNVQWSDPFHGSGTYTWSTCVRPGDTGQATVSFEANGGAPRSYRFTFR